jgi:hypothetical protein
MKVKISKGNSKLGSIPNVSLPPIISCAKGIPCAKTCYAMKAYRMYPNVKTCWNDNLQLAKTNKNEYFKGIFEYLRKNNVNYFRWHTSGDILDSNYFTNMVNLALLFDTKFLVFTKNYDIVNKYLDKGGIIPKNFTVVLSAWPEYELKNPHKLPVAWMQDGTEDRISSNAFECQGSCKNCKTCFGTKKDIVFHKH